MAEPTLEHVFGAGATQDSSTITIQKSALAAAGLTVSAVNTAESILTALILIAKDNLTEVNRSLDLTNRHISITYSGQDLVTQNEKLYRRDVFTVLLYKESVLAGIEPDDY